MVTAMVMGEKEDIHGRRKQSSVLYYRRFLAQLPSVM